MEIQPGRERITSLKTESSCSFFIWVNSLGPHCLVKGPQRTVQILMACLGDTRPRSWASSTCFPSSPRQSSRIPCVFILEMGGNPEEKTNPKHSDWQGADLLPRRGSQHETRWIFPFKHTARGGSSRISTLRACSRSPWVSNEALLTPLARGNLGKNSLINKACSMLHATRTVCLETRSYTWLTPTHSKGLINSHLSQWEWATPG